MVCPECGSSNAKTELQDVKMGCGCCGVLGGWLLMSLGLIGAAGAFGLGMSLVLLIAFIILLVVVPKKATISICQDCGCTFDPKSGKKMKF